MHDRARAEELARDTYTRLVVQDPETGRYTAWLLEFPGCIVEEDTAAEAIATVDRVLVDVIEVMLETGRAIPRPINAMDYNGRISLRIPPNLHREAVTASALLGVSLNRFLSDAIARHIGTATTPTP